MIWYLQYVKTVKHSYHLLTFDKDGIIAESTLEVHKTILSELYNINWKRFKTIYSVVHDQYTQSKYKIVHNSNSGGHNRISEHMVGLILAAPTYFPCLTSHYATVSLEVEREYRYSADLSLFDFWKKALETTGRDDAFIAQSKRMKFWPTYDNKARSGPKRDYLDDKEKQQLKPSFSYDFARHVSNHHESFAILKKNPNSSVCFSHRSIRIMTSSLIAGNVTSA